jgi:hypothetical protein
LARLASLCTAINDHRRAGKPSGYNALDFAGLFPFTDAVVGVDLAVERLRVMNGTRIESALFFLLQERTTLRDE